MVNTNLGRENDNETDDKIEPFDKVLKKRKQDEDSVDLFATKMFNPKKKDDPFNSENFGDFNI